MIGKLKTDFDYITDVFTGIDGGGRFVFAKSGLEELQKRCGDLDMDASEILVIVHRFATLLRTLQPDFIKEMDNAGKSASYLR